MMHVWVGNFKSKKELETYLDQQKYLKAWEAYDHEPPTGNAQDDAEPDPGLRCLFCKETGLDTYSEDGLIVKYYQKPLDLEAVANDILAPLEALEKLYNKSHVPAFNAVIAYEDSELAKAAASKTVRVKYLGQLRPVSEQGTASAEAHYLWVGDNALDKKSIIKQAGLDKDAVIKLNYYSLGRASKLDEMLVLQVEDFNVAEKMILKVDKMKITTAHSMLDLVVKSNAKIEPATISLALKMKYIGKFDKG